MSETKRSGIYLQGSRMRYAEIEHAQERLRLRRLGSCDFDFDAESVMLTGDRGKLETIREAVADVFAGSAASDFSVVLSPASAISFFSPVSDRSTEEAKKRQLEADTVLLGGRDASLNVVAEPVMSERAGGDEAVTWYHVCAVPAQVRRNVMAFLAAFPDARHHVTTCMQASARLASTLETLRPARVGRPATAVVGCFADSTEIAILEDATWKFGSRSAAVLPSDITYSLLNTLEMARVRPGQLGRVDVYGDNADSATVEALKTAAPAEVALLDPLEVVQNDPVTARSSFEPGKYVLCVGAAL